MDSVPVMEWHLNQVSAGEGKGASGTAEMRIAHSIQFHQSLNSHLPYKVLTWVILALK